MSATATISLDLLIDDEGTILLQKFKKRIKDFGESTADQGEKLAKRAFGFRAAGFASENFSEAVGVSGRAANLVGDHAEDLARKALPAYGFMLGAASVSALALGAGIAYLINDKARLREELEKTVTAMTADTDALYSSEQKTKALQKATQELAAAKRPELIEKERNLLYEATQSLKKSVSELELLRQVQAGAFLDQAEGGGFGGLTDNLGSLQNKIGESAAEINFQAERQQLHLANPDMGYSESERLAAEAAYNKTVTELWKQDGISFQKLMRAEMDAFNEATDAKLAAMTNADQRKDFTAQRRMELKALMAQETREHAKSMAERMAAMNKASLEGLQAEQARRQAFGQSVAGINQYLPVIMAGINQSTDKAKAEREQQEKVFWEEANARAKALKSADEQEAYGAERRVAFDNMQSERDAKYQKTQQDMMMGVGNFTMDIFASLTAGGRKNAKENFETQRAILRTQALANTIYAIWRVYKDYSYPYNIILAALVGIAGFAQVSTISGTHYDSGGTLSIPSPPEYLTDANIMREPVTNIYVVGDILDMKRFLSKVVPDINKNVKLNVFKKPAEIRSRAA